MAAGQPRGAPGGRLDADGLAELGERVGALVERLEAHPDPEVASAVADLLAGIDRLHREALGRLAALLSERGLLTTACSDPVVGTTLALYDLAAPEPRPAAPRAPVVPGDGSPTAFIPRGDVARMGSLPPPPRWDDVAGVDEVPPGTMLSIPDARVVVCNVGGTLHALHNGCADGPLVLHLGHLDGAMLTCPWHRDCVYDVTTGGRRGDAGARGVSVYPVAVEHGRVHVALDRRMRGASPPPAGPPLQ